MVKQKVYKISGEIRSLKPAHVAPERTYYDQIWIRESNERQTTLQKVSAPQELNVHLSVGQTATLYLVQSPSGNNCLFGIDAGTTHAESVEPIGRDQAKAFRAGIKWVVLGLLLCAPLVAFLLLPLGIEGFLKWLILVILGGALVVGLVVTPLAVRAMIMLSKAPKPRDLRAFLAGNRAAA